MEARPFNPESVRCPLCQQATGQQGQGTICGLWICHSCQEKLVITRSGHYVRDPFTWKQGKASQLLRQQSRPWARLLRDMGPLGAPSLFVGLLGSLLLVGLTISSWNWVSPQMVSPPTEASSDNLQN